MDVLIIAQYGQQPPNNTMRRYHNWGKELVKRGHKVTIISASALHNTDFDYIKALGTDHSACDGVEYLYVKTPQYTGNGVARINNMLRFCLGLKKFTSLNPDIVIICGAYLYGITKLFFRRCSVVTDTVDLWPESIIEYAGFSKTNPMIQYLYHLEKKSYMKSDALIFSMEGGADYVREQNYADRVDFSKVFHINMGCDIAQKDKELEGISVELGWDPNDFNIVYCGSIRQANQVQQICDAAWEIQKR